MIIYFKVWFLHDFMCFYLTFAWVLSDFLHDFTLSPDACVGFVFGNDGNYEGEWMLLVIRLFFLKLLKGAKGALQGSHLQATAPTQSSKSRRLKPRASEKRFGGLCIEGDESPVLHGLWFKRHYEAVKKLGSYKIRHHFET